MNQPSIICSFIPIFFLSNRIYNNKNGLKIARRQQRAVLLLLVFRTHTHTHAGHRDTGSQRQIRKLMCRIKKKYVQIYYYVRCSVCSLFALVRFRESFIVDFLLLYTHDCYSTRWLLAKIYAFCMSK